MGLAGFQPRPIDPPPASQSTQVAEIVIAPPENAPPTNPSAPALQRIYVPATVPGLPPPNDLLFQHRTSVHVPLNPTSVDMPGLVNAEELYSNKLDTLS